MKSMDVTLSLTCDRCGQHTIIRRITLNACVAQATALGWHLRAKAPDYCRSCVERVDDLR